MSVFFYKTQTCLTRKSFVTKITRILKFSPHVFVKNALLHVTFMKIFTVLFLEQTVFNGKRMCKRIPSKMANVFQQRSSLLCVVFLLNQRFLVLNGFVLLFLFFLSWLFWEIHFIDEGCIFYVKRLSNVLHSYVEQC